MAIAAKQLLGSSFGLSVTGVAGPDEQDGQPVGTVFVGLAFTDGTTTVTQLKLPGDRERVRQYATIGALNLLRQHLVSQVGASR